MIRILMSLVVCVLGVDPTVAQTFDWEANELPENAGWTLVQAFCDPQTWQGDGWFYQHVDLCPGYSPPGGQSSTYQRQLADFAGAPDFFVAWRVQSDAQRSDLDPWSGGALLSISGLSRATYRTDSVSDQVWLLRSNFVPSVYVDIDPAIPHDYRVEVHGSTSYAWYIDNELVDSGTPLGPFPTAESTIIWRTRAAWGPSTSRWDYIRYGRIPQPPTGDLNCDAAVNNFDIDPFVLALTDSAAYAAQFPTCDIGNADVNGDGHIDNFDIDPFVTCLIAGRCN